MFIEARKSPANGALLVKFGSSEHRLQAGVAAERPPLLLHVGLREPLEVLQRVVLALGIGDTEIPCPPSCVYCLVAAGLTKNPILFGPISL
jgi:hypothetical protein